jgi:hypothetical protein
MSKTAEELAQETNEIIEGLKGQIEKAASSEDLVAVKNELSGMVEKLNEINEDKYKDAITELEEKVAQLEEGKTPKETTKSFVEALKDVQDNLKKVVAGETTKEFVIKANTTRASVTNNSSAVRLTDIGQLGVKQRSLYDLFPKIQLSAGDHDGTIKYIDWDEGTIVRSAAAAAEGVAFAESTAAFQEYSIELRKIGDTLPVTEEFGEDVATAAAELEMFLLTNVETKIDEQIAVGDGTGQNLTGLMTSTPTYTAAAEGITDANIKDLAKRMATSVEKTRGSKYKCDFVAFNADVFDEIYLKKDANNNYIFDELGMLAGMNVVIDNNLADDTMVVGDSRYARIYEMNGVAISRGYTGTQFASDLQTIKARKRILFLMREVDKTGFAKSAGIAADLVTLAT